MRRDLDPAAWHAATPFPHLVLDDVLSPDALQELRLAVSRTPHWPNQGELYEMMASGDFDHPALADLPALARAATGIAVQRIETRSYVYLPGSYLLPHTDFGESRRVSWALYLTVDCDGGELRLFDCDTHGDVITVARHAVDIAPRENRLVLFDVSPRSLHEVREVTRGARVSLAGWFRA